MRERTRLRAVARRVLRPLAARPDFLVVGAQKAATTALFGYLGGLPDVRLPSAKELDYFTDHHHEGPGWYAGQFPIVRGRRRWLTGEASPYYLVHPRVPALVAAELPAVKIVVLVRNPVDRAYSAWSMRVRHGHETRSFEDGLALEREVFARERALLLADPRHPNGLHRGWSYVARGRYAEQLATWERHVPAERTLVLVTEQLAADPVGQLARLHAFLELRPPEPGARLPRVHVGSYDQMDPATRRRLEAELHEPNAALSERLGLELREWGWS